MATKGGRVRFTERRIGDTGRKAEKKAAKRLGGRTRAASGAVTGYKGDIVLPSFLCENKSTRNASLSIKLDWLEKISREAASEGKAPVLTVQFTDGNGNPVRFGRWVLVEESVFEEVKRAQG